MKPAIRFGRVTADGTHVTFHITVIFGPFEHPTAVRMTEERATKLADEMATAIATLARLRLAR
ncbi:MAG TPA: hypothetical protein VFE26_10950 [Trebonia sp.]|jgi:hypothetical protein|nr:hypothetical protein [Trebonia sp.]